MWTIRKDREETMHTHTSERLIYRPYETKDLEALIKLCNEKTYRRWFYFLPKLNEKRAKTQIERNWNLWHDVIDMTKDQYAFAIEEKCSGDLIGSVEVSKYHGKKKLKHFEVGYYIGESYQNKGYATEAVNHVIKWAEPYLKEKQEELRVFGKVEHKNIASLRVLEKAGFKLVRKTVLCRIYERWID